MTDYKSIIEWAEWIVRAEGTEAQATDRVLTLAHAILAAVVTEPSESDELWFENEDLPGMWDKSDFTGGETDC